MGMQAVALVMSALLSVLGGGLLGKRKPGFAAAIALLLLAFWWWFNGHMSGTVQVLHSTAGLLLLACAGVCLAHRSVWPAGLLMLSVAVVWVGSYFRMNIVEWVQGDNSERLHWFQLLGDVTAWGLVAVGASMLLLMWDLGRRMKS